MTNVEHSRYTDEYTTLYRGDCMQVMQELIEEGVKVDVIIADPPYGVTQCGWDTPLDLDDLWLKLKQLRKERTPIILFAQTPFDKVLGVSNIEELKYEWVWEKPQATGHLFAKKQPMRAHENILVFYKKAPKYEPQFTEGHKPMHKYTKNNKVQNKSDLYKTQRKELKGGGSTKRYPRTVLYFAKDTQKVKLHPTQKPEALLDYLVSTYVKEGDTVLDFTMGSGTTNVVCKKKKVKSIGIEKEEDIYLKAVHRVQSIKREEGEI